MFAAGTIMQNDWDELFAVLDLLCPNCLGEYGGFVEYYSKPIKRGQSSTANSYEVVKVRSHCRLLCVPQGWINGCCNAADVGLQGWQGSALRLLCP
jgi:hypothetical protein